MTPEQREGPAHPKCPFCNTAPRYLAHKAGFYEEKVICDTCDFSLPPTLWSRRAQVEALTVPQWQPIETAPQDGYMLVHEDGAIRAKLRFNGEWQHVAYPAIIGQWGDAIVGEDAKRMLPAGCRLEMRDGCCENPTHWMPIPAAPTIPAIPGTKEGA